MTASKAPPPLPPRNSVSEESKLRPIQLIDSSASSTTSPGDTQHPLDPPPAYSQSNTGWTAPIHANDPRSSSTQSLSPDANQDGTKRKLLLIYMHGFYGNDQSFRSFPAHLHALLTTLLVDSHVIHSKIYPRYKTYRAISVARDNFSAWLEPHECPNTDVILVGHSMGGLLAAEVVLLPNHDPHRPSPFKHRILGTISLDSPFLGLHPGIVVSGIASLFAPAPSAPTGNPQETDPTLASTPSSLTLDSSSAISQPSPSISSQSSARPDDPYYDPPYFNDRPFREQPFIKRIQNFATKHKADGLFNAMGNHVMSHLEFGGCLADYPGMSARYNKIRTLEDVDELKKLVEGHPSGAFAQVRFVNYYTLSPGKPKPPTAEEDKDELDVAKLALEDTTTQEETPEITENRQAILETNMTIDGKEDQDTAGDDLAPLETLDPQPLEADEFEDAPDTQPLELAPSSASTSSSLPPIPDTPVEPVLPDLDAISDKDLRKQAEKESKRLQKAYDQAVKNREKAIAERNKLIEKKRKKDLKESTKLDKLAEKEFLSQQKKAAKEAAAQEKAVRKQSAADDKAARKAAQPPKLRKFCTLPDKVNGVRDATWVNVFMADMDEIEAHCALFAPGPHYDTLVTDVGERILGWVHDDLSKRTALAMMNE